MFVMSSYVQSIYGIYIFHVKSIVHEKVASLGELQVHGILNHALSMEVKRNMFLELRVYIFGD